MKRRTIDARPPRRGILLGALVLAAVAVAVRAQELRTWTDSSGEFSVKAAFLSEADGKVTLEREDGTKLVIRADQLSPADQKVLAELKAKRRAENPVRSVEGSPFREQPEEGKPRLVEVDWSKSREVSAAPVDSEWKFDVARASGNVTPKAFRPVTTPKKVDFFEKFSGMVISVPSSRVLFGYGHRSKDEALLQRYFLADMATGEGLPFELNSLEHTMAPMALADDGTTALMRKSEFGFGKSDYLETWSFADSGVERHLQWYPYQESRGGNRDIKWAGFVAEGRALTVSGGGKLVLWDTTTAEPVYHLAIKGGSVPGLSADRKYLCYSRGDDIGVLDVAKGEVLAAQKVGSLTWPHLRFNPGGTKIACLDHTRVRVWDFASGELLLDMSKRGLPSGGFCFVSENHLLVSGKTLFDVHHRLAVWSYDGAEAVEEFGDYTCLLTRGSTSASGLLMIERLPPSTVTETVAKAMEAPDFWVFTEGTRVKLNLDGLPDLDRVESVRAAFTTKLAERGCQVGDDGTIELVVSIAESKKKKEVSYGRAFGPFARGGVPFKVREFISRAMFIYEGKTAWEQTGTNIPTSFSLKDGEAITEALKRFEKPNYGWFEKLELPLVLRKPTGSPTLGKTQVTSAGLR